MTIFHNISFFSIDTAEVLYITSLEYVMRPPPPSLMEILDTLLRAREKFLTRVSKSLKNTDCDHIYRFLLTLGSC